MPLSPKCCGFEPHMEQHTQYWLEWNNTVCVVPYVYYPQIVVLSMYGVLCVHFVYAYKDPRDTNIYVFYMRELSLKEKIHTIANYFRF